MRNTFDELSADYSRYRPRYPDALSEYLVDRCGLTARSRVLDVGAGTGKGSAMLAEHGIRPVSVEQSFLMIRQGVDAYPGSRFVCGNAEALGVASASFDLVTSAQALHLFDLDRSLPEFARVLKPGAFLAVYWYCLDLSLAHTQAIAGLLDSFESSHDALDQAGQADWQARLEHGGRFEVVDQQRFSYSVPMTSEDWVGLARTIPALRASGASFETSLRNQLARYDSVDCPYVADLWLARPC